MNPAKWILLLFLAAGCDGVQQSSKVTLPLIEMDVPPGSEVQDCIYLKSPNETDVDLSKVTMQFSEGTHHVHVYFSDRPHEDGRESCFQAVDFDRWHLLAATQKKDLEWEFPSGVAFRLHAHQQILIQVHYVNAGMLLTDNNKGYGNIHFDTRAPGEVKSYMGSIFGQQRLIDIQPYANYSVDGICRLPRAVNLAALAGHYHFKGKQFIASRLDPGATTGSEFYRTSDFAEPNFDIYQPGQMTFTEGERIMWHCDYRNDSYLRISFGPRELTQEHCNMFAFYYPAEKDQEFTPCVSWGRCKEDCDIGQVCSELGECVSK